MKMTNRTKLLSLILCVVLTWTAALLIGCTGNTKETPDSGTPAVTTTVPAESSEVTTEKASDAATELGEGDTAFTFTVTDKDGSDTVFNIKTNKTTVGEALQELGLIEGEDGEFGLYVKKVNGITADYNIDGTYWAFYVNGEYGMTGVDSTIIEAGASYGFKVEK